MATESEVMMHATAPVEPGFRSGGSHNSRLSITNTRLVAETGRNKPKRRNALSIYRGKEAGYEFTD